MSSPRSARNGKPRPCSSHSPDGGPRRPVELEEPAVLSAVHGQCGCGDEARAVARQEYDRRRQFIGASMPAKWDVAQASRGEFLGIDAELDRLVPVFFDDVIGFKAAGEDGVDAN